MLVTCADIGAEIGCEWTLSHHRFLQEGQGGLVVFWRVSDPPCVLSPVLILFLKWIELCRIRESGVSKHPADFMA